MLIDWTTSENFKHKCEVNKRNRASKGKGEDGVSNYTGGSKCATEYVLEFKEKQGRDITIEELMNTTYTNKNTGTCSTRAEKCMEHFKQLIQVWLESNPNLSKEDELMLWNGVVSGEKKGHLFGQGTLFYKDAYVLNPPTPGPNPAARVLTPATPPPTLTVAPDPFLMTPAAHVLTPTDYAPTPTATPVPTPFPLPPAGLNQPSLAPFLLPQV